MGNNTELLLTFVIGIALFVIMVAFIISFVFIFQKRQEKHRIEKETLKINYEREILKSQLEVQNQTLQEIGQELHDNIGQLLSVARIYLNILEDSTINDENGYLKQTNEIIAQSINDLRALTKSFDGDFVQQFGLTESLSNEMSRIQKTKRFDTEVNIIGEKYSLGYEREIVLFRVAQEILNNALKYSKAKKINVLLNFTPNTFELIIEDNGKGFDLEAIKQKEINQSGAGLRNIQRRVKLIGGIYSIHAETGKGTKISIKVSL
jgi:signal transduction histidine kinase